MALIDQFVSTLNQCYDLAKGIYDVIPGSSLIYKYVQQSHQNDPWRTVLEIFLVLFMLWYFNRRKYRPGNPDILLSEKEIDLLCEEWEPEPLVPKLSSLDASFLTKLNSNVQTGTGGIRVKTLDGKDKLNISSFNYLGLMNRESIKDKAIAALRKYGVGSCGPPGFYGTIDVHIELEQKLASFFGTESAIIYSQGFSTVSSLFQKRGYNSGVFSFIFFNCDDAISLATQVGIGISRSHVHFFKHNDMEDLENVLNAIKNDEIKKRKPLTRKFLIVEGLYLNKGDIAPLPKLIELKNKFKYRIIVEESNSVGGLGKTGKGISEHFNIPITELDIVCSAMSNALGSAGGFVVGTKEIVEHQRLSGQAYTFSAALPALLAVSCTEALNIMEAEGETLMKQLMENINYFRTLTSNISEVAILGDIESPIIHFQIKRKFKTRDQEEELLQSVVDLAFKEGVLVTRAKYVLKQEMQLLKPSIRVSLSAGFTRKEIEKIGSVLVNGFKTSLKAKPI